MGWRFHCLRLSYAKLRGEVKCAALTHLTLNPYTSTHHFHQAGSDGQTQPRSAVLAGDTGVSLRERLKNDLSFVVRDADSCIAYLKWSSARPSACKPDSISTNTCPSSVNLTALPTKLVNICRSLPGSPVRCEGTSGLTS